MSSELNITNGMSGEDPGRNEANLSSAKGRQVGPASWPVVDRTGGLSHGECGTKPIGRGRWRFPKRSQFAKVSAVGQWLGALTKRSQFQGNPRGARGTNGMGFLAKRSKFRILSWCESGGGLGGGQTMKKRWSAARLKNSLFANAPTWLQGRRRLEQGIPGK